MLTSIADRRCVISQAPLASDEVFISRRAVPVFYDVNSDASADAVLETLVQATIELAYQPSFRDAQAREPVRRFWVRMLDRAAIDSARREQLLHAYLYLFSDRPMVESGDDPLAYEEGFIPQNDATWDKDSNFCNRLVSRVRKEAPVDILARDGTRVLMIEVKYAAVDDRALGQMMRYFESIRRLMNTVDHLCDLRTLVPVFVAQTFPPAHWDALPSSFRELVRVYYYRIEMDELVLRDGRRGLQAQLRQSRSHRF